MENLRSSLEKFQCQINLIESKGHRLRKSILEKSVENDNDQHKIEERKYTLERNTKKLEKLTTLELNAKFRYEELVQEKIAYEQRNQHQSQQLTLTSDAYIKSLKHSRDLNVTLEKYKMEILHLQRKLEQLNSRIYKTENKIALKSREKELLRLKIETIKKSICQVEDQDMKESYELDELECKVKQLSYQLELATSNTKDKQSDLDQSKREYTRICQRINSVILEIEHFDKNILCIDDNDDNKQSESSLSVDTYATSTANEYAP